MDGECLTVKGNEFHARAAATGKARSPSVERRVDGTRSVRAADERRRRWESAAKWSEVDRYDGAVPCRQRYTRTHKRNCILSVTFSQWRSRRFAVTWVVSVTFELIWNPRSRTVVTEEIIALPSWFGVVGSWCWRRVEVHQRTSVFVGFSCRRLDMVHAETSSKQFAMRAWRSLMSDGLQNP